MGITYAIPKGIKRGGRRRRVGGSPLSLSGQKGKSRGEER